MLVITNLNKVLVVTYGMIFLNETSTTEAIIGIIIALTGGLLYGQDRKRMQVKRETKLAGKTLLV